MAQAQSTMQTKFLYRILRLKRLSVVMLTLVATFIHEMSKIECREKVENGERGKKMASTVDCRIKVELSQPSVGSTHSNEIPRRIGKME